MTLPADIVRLFQPDDRQRYLDRRALWKFDVEGEPWKVAQSGKGAFERAKSYVAYILERALANLLINHEEIIDALTVDKLATLLPRDQLGAIISIALKKGDKFTEAHLLEAVPPTSLVKHIPLDYVWERVINPLIAERHEYSDKALGGIGGKAFEVKPGLGQARRAVVDRAPCCGQGRRRRRSRRRGRDHGGRLRRRRDEGLLEADLRRAEANLKPERGIFAELPLIDAALARSREQERERPEVDRGLGDRRVVELAHLLDLRLDARHELVHAGREPLVAERALAAREGQQEIALRVASSLARVLVLVLVEASRLGRRREQGQHVPLERLVAEPGELLLDDAEALRVTPRSAR